MTPSTCSIVSAAVSSNRTVKTVGSLEWRTADSQAVLDNAGDALGNAADAAGDAVGNVADAAGNLAEKGAAKVENAADAVGNTHVNVNLHGDGGGDNAASEGNRH